MKIVSLKETLGEYLYSKICADTWEKLSLLRKVIIDKKEYNDMTTGITWCINKNCVKYNKCGRNINTHETLTKKDISGQYSMAEFIPFVNDKKNFSCKYFMEANEYV